MEVRHMGDYEYVTKVRPEEALEQIAQAEEFLQVATQHFRPFDRKGPDVRIRGVVSWRRN